VSKNVHAVSEIRWQRPRSTRSRPWPASAYWKLNSARLFRCRRASRRLVSV